MKNDDRLNKLNSLANKIQNSNVTFPDIRNRDWLKLNVPAAKALKAIIEAEDYLIRLDDYQMEKGQIYSELEDMMLQIGYLRKEYTKYIDENTDLLFLGENDI